MELNAFASLAVVQLPSQSRLLASACCPDKDLVILISRLGGKDRMSLWKMQGSKKWEVDVGTEETNAEEIVGIAWSPNGKSNSYFSLCTLILRFQGRVSQ
jgi:anaphase-promoting complex subunit 4